MFSRLELDSPRTRSLARVGQALMDFLLHCPGEEAAARLDSLLADTVARLQEVISASNPHDAVFSPTRLSNTASQLYFLLLGRLSRSPAGRAALDRQAALTTLTELLRVRHDLYLKLVVSHWNGSNISNLQSPAMQVSSLDCSRVDWGRALLSRALTTAPESGRLYATQWLLVLARAGAPSIAVYGVELLVRQLQDESLTVATAALDILDEVCDDKMFLESLVSHCSTLLEGGAGGGAPQLCPGLARLGDRARLLVARCAGSQTGVTLLSSTGWLQVLKVGPARYRTLQRLV